MPELSGQWTDGPAHPVRLQAGHDPHSVVRVRFPGRTVFLPGPPSHFRIHD